MKILLANHWMKKLGGSETFTYTMGAELKRLGWEVYLYTLHPGMVSRMMFDKLKIKPFVEQRYNLVLANHHTTVDRVWQYGKTIQTCHGIFPQLEKPSNNANYHVGISKEINEHLATNHKLFSTLIWNGIDCELFQPTKLPEKASVVLSLCHSDTANEMIQKACDEVGMKLVVRNKFKNPTKDVAGTMKSAHVVVSLGRGAYEAFASGKPTIIFDARPYQPALADGYVDESNILGLMENNCSGRFSRKVYGVQDLVDDLKKYNPKDGQFLREFAHHNLNIKWQVQKYLKFLPGYF